ncbi:hypothetical protein NPX13_g3702 [Xylaria arbuscula]|uniref:Uncharacterized protein n=1 Tax=Xylaria arbuscula TaxID=114810 RepID=A0A9W8NHY5_9PEZI|nr:hypothetical protein NPX13_g3702 [Xylaria arbuscula]
MPAPGNQEVLSQVVPLHAEVTKVHGVRETGVTWGMGHVGARQVTGADIDSAGCRRAGEAQPCTLFLAP